MRVGPNRAPGGSISNRDHSRRSCAGRAFIPPSVGRACKPGCCRAGSWKRAKARFHLHLTILVRCRPTYAN